MTKWEYLCLDANQIQKKAIKARQGTGEAFDEGINVLGAEGWELAMNEGNWYCFKRPLN